jgi:hypothetical protein
LDRCDRDRVELYSPLMRGDGPYTAVFKGKPTCNLPSAS